jgi:cysteinyl-tRNA synthetase
LEDALQKTTADPAGEAAKTWQTNLETYRQKFREAMDDDFNTAGAFAVLFELAREANIYLNSSAKPRREDLALILEFYRETDEIFGFMKKQAGENSLEEEITSLIADRETARRQKDWARADSIRDQLREKGVVLEDTPQGTRWRILAEQGTEG